MSNKKQNVKKKIKRNTRKTASKSSSKKKTSIKRNKKENSISKKNKVKIKSGKRSEKKMRRGQTSTIHGITRSQFLKLTGIAAAGLGATMLGMSGTSQAKKSTDGLEGKNKITLYGDQYSTPEETVAAVQAAVDSYEKVILSGTFDFGDFGDGSGYAFIGNPGQVSINKDVKIVGEGATILGGFFSIFCNESVNLTIKNIIFDGATTTAIGVSKASGVTIEGCEFYNHKYAFFGQNKRVVPITFSTAALTQGVPSDISGKIIVKECIVDAYLSGYEAELSMGIILQRVSADAVIKENVFKNSNWASIADDASPGNIEIKDNVIEPGPFQAPFIPGAAVLIGGFPVPFPIGDRIVKDNKIKCVSLLHSGILFSPFRYRTDAVFKFNDNTIDLRGYDASNPLYLNAGIHLAWNASNSKCKDNIITGTMGAAVLMEARHYAYKFPPFSSFPPGQIQNNEIKEVEVEAANSMYGVLLAGDVFDNLLKEFDFGGLSLFAGGEMLKCEPEDTCENNDLDELFEE